MKKSLLILTLLISFVSLTENASAHCEVPCGIYNDSLRVELIKEHIQTIEKAMNQITEIQNSGSINYNQLIRWINTKEQHANLIQEIAEQYFLTQKQYFSKLTGLLLKHLAHKHSEHSIKSERNVRF